MHKIEFATIASGSKGNCIYVGTENTKILIEIRYKAWKSGFNSFGDFLTVAIAQLGMYILPIGFQKFLYQKILRR